MLAFERALFNSRHFFTVTGNGQKQLALLKEVTQKWLEANAGRGAERTAALQYREIWELFRTETESAGYNSALLMAGDVFTGKKPANAPRDGGNGGKGDGVTKADLAAALKNLNPKATFATGDKKGRKGKKAKKSEYGADLDNRSAETKAAGFCGAFNSGACSLSKCGKGAHRCSEILTNKSGVDYVCGKNHARVEHS